MTERKQNIQALKFEESLEVKCNIACFINLIDISNGITAF
jgi:hypothetical protein